MGNEHCVFCLIAKGDVPARIVYEDAYVVAFDDIAPQAPIHTLIIPREHFDTMSDSVPSHVMAGIFSAVPKVAEAKGLTAPGYRVIINNGVDANQTVQHLHVHVMGGRRLSHGMVSFATD